MIVHTQIHVEITNGTLYHIGLLKSAARSMLVHECFEFL